MSDAAQVDLGAYRDLVGKALPQPEQFNYEVSRDSIRHFAYCIPDYNALYLDQEFARSTRWGSVIAPPGYLYSHGMSTWLRMFGGLKDSEGRELKQNDNAGETWEFFRPVRVGDTVYSHGKVLSAEAKTGRRLGPCALVKSEVLYTNQYSELVARAVGVSFRFNAPAVAAGGGLAKAYPPMAPGQTTRAVSTPGKMPGNDPTPTRRIDPQLFFEDVNEGDSITPWELGPIAINHMSSFNSAIIGRGYDEFGAVHGGAVPDAFAAGPMRVPWFGTMLSRWAGPNAWITTLTQQNHEWVLVGFKIICGGRVARKYRDGSRCLVECEIWCNSELGFRTNSGKATVELPSRG